MTFTKTHFLSVLLIRMLQDVQDVQYIACCVVLSDCKHNDKEFTHVILKQIPFVFEWTEPCA